jgi:hypothetical protein
MYRNAWQVWQGLAKNASQLPPVSPEGIPSFDHGPVVKSK